MSAINRNAIVVTPQQPFLDWLHKIDSDNADLTLDEIRQEPTVYVLPECFDKEEAAARLGQASKAIFEEELNSWYTDPAMWPAKRDQGTFSRWFQWSYQSVILDLVDAPIEHE